tara:strand:+ start:717 stop:1055 length:339 start_codon:yes stop_codon:yes gene_type:complete
MKTREHFRQKAILPALTKSYEAEDWAEYHRLNKRYNDPALDYAEGELEGFLGQRMEFDLWKEKHGKPIYGMISETELKKELIAAFRAGRDNDKYFNINTFGCGKNYENKQTT